MHYAMVLLMQGTTTADAPSWPRIGKEWHSHEEDMAMGEVAHIGVVHQVTDHRCGGSHASLEALQLTLDVDQVLDLLLGEVEIRLLYHHE